MVQSSNAQRAPNTKNIEIRVGNEKPFASNTGGDTLYTTNTVCGLFKGPAVADVTDSIECLVPLTGRYVTLQRIIEFAEHTVLSMNEVLIVSSPAVFEGEEIEILLRSSPVLGQCPSNYPYAYLGGASCCSSGMEDTGWFEEGSFGLLNFDSLTCGGGKTTCPTNNTAPCYNYQYQRYSCFIEEVDISGYDDNIGKEDNIEKCLERATKTAGSSGFLWYEQIKNCWVKTGPLEVILPPVPGLKGALLPCP